jgi:hypothetical protein
MLFHRFEENTRVQVKCDDSRKYRHRDGTKYDLIFTSFAEDHIRPSDRPEYYENIKRNLKDDGRFIIGCEFIPEYQFKNEREWRDALERYHGHIIEDAERKGNSHLAELERQALKSGLNRIGDFKVPVKVYEDTLNRHGLRTMNSHKIGPVREDFGGVWVYEIAKRP